MYQKLKSHEKPLHFSTLAVEIKGTNSNAENKVKKFERTQNATEVTNNNRDCVISKLEFQCKIMPEFPFFLEKTNLVAHATY